MAHFTMAFHASTVNHSKRIATRLSGRRLLNLPSRLPSRRRYSSNADCRKRHRHFPRYYTIYKATIKPLSKLYFLIMKQGKGRLPHRLPCHFSIFKANSCRLSSQNTKNILNCHIHLFNRCVDGDISLWSPIRREYAFPIY